jgi:CRP-like cAMP-binding protein
MTEEEVRSALRSYVDISDTDLDYFFKKSQFKKVRKNQLITSKGDEELYFILIRSGCLMTYYEDKSNKKHVIQFGTEMWWTGDLESFTKGESSRYSIKAVVDSEVYLISRDLYDRMLIDIPAFDRYFRIIFQNALISHQRRIIRNISYTAEEKYQEFVKYYPKIEMIVPQKYIASYLGITPEFLSKIRSKLAGR